ncbi:hypothetical protein ACJMK2_012357 [Sinanodonta woodiana]|uniref:Coiled-coil domain-containing protein 157 n=1 Tax=Sinanodonta woodiana TaxID=1069815 RepID=A0ABD3V873_SINWO
MVDILGARAVIESLRSDVKDVQSVIVDVLSRCGPVKRPSWKFPDKMSCEVDITDLLELYDYSDDEEERQVAHIALYELLIDRLVLLLQCTTLFTNQTSMLTKVDGDSNLHKESSVGLVAKRYWSDLVKMQGAVQKTVADSKLQSRKISELENSINQVHYNRNDNRPKTAGFRGLIPPNRAEAMLGVSFNPENLHMYSASLAKDEYNKSCQTNDTVFTPCESCSYVQKCFRQTGDTVINICQSQQLPSCLQKFRPLVADHDWLTASDIARWSTEQQKDMTRISKHMENLTVTVKSLKEYEEKCKKLEKRVLTFDREMQREKDERSEMHHNYERKIRDMESNHEKNLELERHEKEMLKLNKSDLEKLLEKHKLELEEKLHILKELERTKCKLEVELSENRTNTEEVQKLEREMSDLRIKLDDISVKMESSAKELSREQAKSKSAFNHSQNMKSKQEALLRRVDTLDQENVELRDQVAALEEEKESIEESLEKAKNDVEQWKKTVKDKEAQVEQLQSEKDRLEESISSLQSTIETLQEKLEEEKEKERLLVEYPDLNGPVNRDIAGSGDIVYDMENQVKANNSRINLLEEQNEGLRNSIQKILAIQRQQPQHHIDPEPQPKQAKYVKTGPVLLWKTTEVDKHVSENRNKNTNNAGDLPKGKSKTQSPDQPPSTANAEEFLVGHSVRPSSAKKDGSSARSRPSSGKTSSKMVMAPVNTTSISAYMQIKRAGKLNLNSGNSPPNSTVSKPPTGKSPVNVPRADAEYSPSDMFVCDRCDKMYSRARDLEIHKSYCTS